MSVPHLIHVGFPKCGSKYLQRWFAAHPEIAYCWDGFGGERGVEDFLRPFVQGDQDKRCRVTSHEALTAPRDPANLGIMDRKEFATRQTRVLAVANELALRFPDARILIVTRNHVDMVRSGFSEMVRQGGGMTAEQVMAAGHDPDFAAGYHHYDFTVAQYERLFPGRVLVLPVEWLADDPAAFLNILADFAGVARRPGEPQRVNPSLSPEEQYWYPRFAQLLNRVRPGRLRTRLNRVHQRAISRGSWKPLLVLLRLFFGRRSAQLRPPDQLLEEMCNSCRALVERPYHVPYRAAYLGS